MRLYDEEGGEENTRIKYMSLTISLNLTQFCGVNRGEEG